MARYETAPTRTNLLRLKGDLAFANEGYELLEQKREILVMELKRFTARAVDAQRRADEELAKAYAALREAQIATGVGGVGGAAPAVNIRHGLTLSERRVMGVSIPAVHLELEERAPHYGPTGTSVWTDEAVMRFKGAVQALAALAEARIAAVRLAREIRKTIRRVNALERVFIPDYAESVKYVEDALEESEREEFATLKAIKARLESARRGV